MRRLAAALLALTVATGAVAARAAVLPEPGPGDPRIRIVHYDPNEVVELPAVVGYQMTIEFGPGERIENVSIGDGLGWQITPNHRANLLFLKPLGVGRPTDMSVVTNLRSYLFDLHARRAPAHQDRSLIFRLQFDYPEPFVALAEPPPPPPPPEPPKDVNHAYRIVGAATIQPSRMFDDGHSTYFAFPDTAELPAIFAIDPDQHESLANIAIRQGYVVVDRLAAAFVLRHGKQLTRIVNDGFPAAAMAQGPARPVKRHRGLSP